MTPAHATSSRSAQGSPAQPLRLAPPERVGSASEVRERVLVIDDESSLRKLIARMVRTTGHRVETASNAADAREWLESREFALAICDLRMPGEPGTSLVRWIRSEHPDVAVLIATGADDPAMADAALAAGAYGYLTKPFKRNEVAQAVGASMEQMLQKSFDR